MAGADVAPRLLDENLDAKGEVRCRGNSNRGLTRSDRRREFCRVIDKGTCLAEERNDFPRGMLSLAKIVRPRSTGKQAPVTKSLSTKCSTA